ncbi:MAG: Fe-S oxidoreductase [Thermoanaerobacterales bacterium 50_218]|nr:MAG: Fe-S oxidoreductase [Thermoanaerobacterales bacterium 50_218]HAA90329.1 radical SAM protein [Peptococcaceae bacterium]
MSIRLNLGFAKKVLGEKLIEQALNYIGGNPETNIPRFLRLIETIARAPGHKESIQKVQDAYQNDPVMREYLNKLFYELDPGVQKRLVCNLVLNALLLGRPRQIQIEQEEGIHVPFTFLIDPTSACNLKCIGCWAGEYKKHDQLEPELLDRIFQEAKELGIYAIVLSGGEPFVYPYLFDIAEKHNDMVFMIYTNGTKIDEKAADRLRELGNMSPVISIEGWEERTDHRRGRGVFRRITQAMDYLRERGVLFGASITITRENVEEVTSDEFIDFLIEKGVKYVWTFHYIPIGREPNVDLMVLPEQRAYLVDRIIQLRTEKPITIIDFWNDGDLIGGCIAGGRCYFHINARGDVEPCAFAHFAVDNIKEKSLKEVLQSPLFKAYQKRQPFSDNLLRPCPIIDVPEALRAIVEESGAYPTHTGADTVLKGEIGAYLDQRAAKWKIISDEIWKRRLQEKEKGVGPYRKAPAACACAQERCSSH